MVSVEEIKNALDLLCGKEVDIKVKTNTVCLIGKINDFEYSYDSMGFFYAGRYDFENNESYHYHKNNGGLYFENDPVRSFNVINNDSIIQIEFYFTDNTEVTIYTEK